MGKTRANARRRPRDCISIERRRPEGPTHSPQVRSMQKPSRRSLNCRLGFSKRGLEIYGEVPLLRSKRGPTTIHRRVVCRPLCWWQQRLMQILELYDCLFCCIGLSGLAGFLQEQEPVPSTPAKDVSAHSGLEQPKQTSQAQQTVWVCKPEWAGRTLAGVEGPGIAFQLEGKGLKGRHILRRVRSMQKASRRSLNIRLGFSNTGLEI